jgi:hypothetical protein
MFITRSYIRFNKNWLFVFGDNLEHRGFGGQAKACRGLTNTVGMPTKNDCYTFESSYFSDRNLDINKSYIDQATTLIMYSMLREGFTKLFIIPGIGQGRAELPTRAPKTFQYLQGVLTTLDKEFNKP